jgi:diamine N-acetyltransferase
VSRALDPVAVVVRRAVPEDREALIGLDVASAAYHVTLDPEFYRMPEREAVATFLDQRLANPDREVFVAVVDGVVVGQVDVTIEDDPDPGSITRPVPTADLGISVLDGWRRQGIGRALMAAAEASARARGAKQIVLDMSAANVDALQFYRSLGYAEHGLLLRRNLA